MHAAFDGGNAVGEGMHSVGVEARIPLERDFDFLVFFGLLVVADLLEECFFRRIQVAHKVDDAAGVFEDDQFGIRRIGTLVLETNLEALIEERHHLESLKQGLGTKDGFVENCGIWPEANGRTRTALRSLSANFEFGGEFSAVREVHVVVVARVVDLNLDPL